jgi:hypothetical protein
MSLFSTLTKYLAAPNTPVTLGTSGQEFDSITFRGFKADGTANTGSVTVAPISPITGIGTTTVPAGGIATLIAPTGTTVLASQFQLDGANAGDGVSASFFVESSVVWTGLEAKVEEAFEALIRTVPSLVASCAIARGIDSETLTANSIIATCKNITARPVAQEFVGNYDCLVRLVVTTQADSSASLTQAQQATKHWDRVARVRDVATDDESLATLSAAVARFTVLESVRDLSTSTMIEDRHFTTEIAFTILAVGSDI